MIYAVSIPGFAGATLWQILIAGASLAISGFVLRIPWATAAWAVALFNAIPLGSFPGFATPVFVHDLVFPFLLVSVLRRGALQQQPILRLAAVAMLLWPLVGTITYLVLGPADNDWIRFVGRRLEFVVFFAAGLGPWAQQHRIRDFLDTGVLVWVGMCIAGVLQYYGVHNVDPTWYYDTALPVAGESAQRGFLGMNRGAVGVWGSMVLGYSLSALLADRSHDRARTLARLGAIALTVIVVLFSGSRTGLIACVVAAIAAVAGSSGRVDVRRVVRAAVLALPALALAGYLVMPGVEIIRQRLGTGSHQLLGLVVRANVQLSTLSYVLSDARAALVGMGESGRQYADRVGWAAGRASHPHSEYLETLWQCGVPGLLLYLLFLAGLMIQMRLGGATGLGAEGGHLPGASWRECSSSVHRAWRARAPGEDRADEAWQAAEMLRVAGPAMLVAGAVCGLAVGNIAITSARLASFGPLMALVYAKMVAEIAATASLPLLRVRRARRVRARKDGVRAARRTTG